MRSKLQKASTHCNWMSLMIKGFMGIEGWFWREEGSYISENTRTKWINIKDQLQFLVQDIKADYEEYKICQTTKDS